jgi:hypothetical protein
MTDDDNRRRSQAPDFLTYELLLIGLGFIAGVFVGMSMSGR